MPRILRDSRIETRTARAKLPIQGRPYWRALGTGLHLGYRRNRIDGTWVVRVYLGEQRYVTETIGLADDRVPADGHIVRDWGQAQAVASERFIALRRQAAGLPAAGVTTIAHVLDAYAKAQEAAGKGAGDLTWRVNALKQDLGTTPIAKITTANLQAWRDGRAAARKPRPGEEPHDAARRARASTNRLWTTLRAALNYGHRAGTIATDDAWRKVKALPDAGAAREHFLSADEATLLIYVCSGGFRDLVSTALATGMRYGELARLRVADFNFETGTLHVARSKSGKARHVYLTDEGRDLVAGIAAGRSGSDLLLRKEDGSNWKKDHQRPPMAEACQRAGIDPPIGFHQLRHTYCSLAVMNGVPLQVVARNAGHATVAMTERHYAHFRPSYVSEEIRRAGPTYGIKPGA
jgi:integrase